MKWLTILLLTLFTVSVYADTGWFYNPDRRGEGIVLSELADGGLVFAFYSHVEPIVFEPPRPSPSPPDALYCDKYNVWLIGVADVYVKGSHAYGDIYYNEPLVGFPIASLSEVAIEHKVGSFEIFPEGDGFVLHMKNNWSMCSLSVFGVDHLFTTKVAE